MSGGRWLLLSLSVSVSALSSIPPADLRAYTFIGSISPRVPASRLALSAPQSLAQRIINGRNQLTCWLRSLSAPPAAAAEEEEMACYVVEGKPSDEIICTSAPREYAWYEGIDPDEMEKVGLGVVVEGHLECREGASHRGMPVWNCNQEDQAV
uniref:Uncharacterized protein n=1 Tax=Strombidinopsis acuminata TaxID=141414 RepID=A0A7S3RX32_9SPIT|mmetsp:Transcript_9256/g.11282  ORF Transcript_9256/g.11282 Transcript_9256/m.11282 type:complete len:153 (-) Transcript_9256:485-943(-)|eukprot:scaffold19304_cov33-Tisochrysis_lutea.AAC.2